MAETKKTTVKATTTKKPAVEKAAPKKITAKKTAPKKTTTKKAKDSHHVPNKKVLKTAHKKVVKAEAKHKVAQAKLDNHINKKGEIFLNEQTKSGAKKILEAEQKRIAKKVAQLQKKHVEKHRSHHAKKLIGSGPRGTLTVEDILKSSGVKKSFKRMLFFNSPRLKIQKIFEDAIEYEIEHRDISNGLYHQKVRTAIQFVKEARITFGIKPMGSALKKYMGMIFNTAKGYEDYALLQISRGNEAFRAKHKWWADAAMQVQNTWRIWHSRSDKIYKEESHKHLLEKLEEIKRRL